MLENSPPSSGSDAETPKATCGASPQEKESPEQVPGLSMLLEKCQDVLVKTHLDEFLVPENTKTLAVLNIFNEKRD